MDWNFLSKLLVFILLISGLAPSVHRQWRDDRAGFIKTLKLMGGFALYCAVGIGLMIALIPERPATGEPDSTAVLSTTAFGVAWIFLGALWLTRVVPRYREVPAWIDRRFGPVELALWGVIGASLLTRFLA
jgi:hypothetical protein